MDGAFSKMMPDNKPRVALVRRGGPDMRARSSAQKGRLAPVFEAVAREAVFGKPAVYREEVAADARFAKAAA